MMKKTALRLMIVLALSIWCHSALAQGLVGQAGGMRRMSQVPPLLPGENDDQRWRIFLKTQPSLIGMRREDVTKIFGAGAIYTTKKELIFMLTEEKMPSHKGKIAYLELTLKFDNDCVRSYMVEAVFWG